MTSPAAKSPWLAAAPDLAAFVFGCSIAWWRGWHTTDLVWSLWLSSLVVGYASIVWIIMRGQHSALAKAGLLAFLTFHFGLFHLIHSLFLGIFFPIIGRGDDFPGVSTYVEVVRRYWVFLPAALLSERAVFSRPANTGSFSTGIDDLDFIQPYRNVFRMHLLIFFFLAAFLFHWQNAAVFIVVYAAYFLPWPLLRRAAPAA